jgi:hypothetical protein
MLRKIILSSVTISLIIVGIVSITRSEAESSKSENRTAQQEARQQRRAERMAKYQKYIDSLVISHNFRFTPQTMQQLPAGIMRNLVNPSYEIVVMDEAVDVCIPYLKGYTPPYYTVVFNYVLPSVRGYTAEQTDDGWHITFSSTLFSANDYNFALDIYNHYGSAVLTLSSTFYNSVQYNGNILGI